VDVKGVMVVFHDRWRRIGAVTVLLIISTAHIIIPSKSQAQPPPKTASQGSPEAVAEAMWQKITSTCPVQGSAKPVVFFEKVETMQPSFQTRFITTVRLLELRNAWTAYRSIDVSEADRLNGVQYRGFTVIGSSVYREFYSRNSDGTPAGWGAFKDGDTRRGFDDDPNNHGVHGLASVGMEKRNGTWSFSPHYDHAAGFDPDLIAAKKRPCAVLTSANPLAASSPPSSSPPPVFHNGGR
jgi:hypothetical protein